MIKLALITLLTASILTSSSADGIGGIMTDMMDIPKEIITSGTDAMRDMKDAATDSMDEIKDSATDSKDDDVSNEKSKVTATAEEPKVSVSAEVSK